MFFNDKRKSTSDVAKALLGCLLVKETGEGTVSGWIVETEAYLGVEDAAAHSFGGRKTPRVKAMYQEPGTIYIYQMHTHLLVNIVTQPKGIPEAVLVRAVQPKAGIELMEKRRGKKGVELTNGPGKLTKAFGITMSDYGSSIEDPPLFIDFSKKRNPAVINETPRIGIPNKGEWTEAPLRFSVRGNPFVSRKKGKVEKPSLGWLS